jgi:WD40 repeat protein
VILCLVPLGDEMGRALGDPPSPLAPDAEKAALLLKQLRERLADAKADPERLRQDLLAFRQAHPGTPQAVEAAGLLRQLASPLDKLSPKAISAIERYDWQPKELVAILGEHRGRMGATAECLVFSPDGKFLVSGGNTSKLRFWEAATMRQQSVLHHSHYVHALGITHDGKMLACGGEDGIVRLWNLGGKAPTERAVLKTAAASSVSALAFSPSGKRLACNGDAGSVRLWDVSEKVPKMQEVLAGHTQRVRSLAFAPDGLTLASGSDDHTVRLWNLGKTPAKERAVLTVHTGEVRAVAFSPNGHTLATAGQDGVLYLWSTTGTAPRQRAAVKVAEMYAVAYAPNGKLLAAGCSDGNVRLYDVSGGQTKEQAVLEGHSGVVLSLAFAPDSKALASGGADCTVRLWRLGGARPFQRTVTWGHWCYAYSMAFAPDGGSLASGGADATIRLWDLGTPEPKEATVLRPAASPVLSLDWSPDSKMLVSSQCDKSVRLWSVAGGRQIRQLEGQKHPVWSVAFSPTGREVVTASARLRDDWKYWTVGEEESLCLWDVASGQEVRRLGGYKEPVRCVAFSPDGRRILSGSVREEMQLKGRVPVDCSVRLWDAASGKELAHMDKHTRPVYAVAFTADGQRAISADLDGTVLLWDPDKPAAPTALPGADDYVTALAVAPDGQTVAGMGAKGKIVLWDVASGKKLRQWQLDEGATCIAFAPDSRHLAIALVGGPVYLLRLSSPKEQPDSRPAESRQPEAEVGRLSKALVEAPPAQRDKLLSTYKTSPGAAYTDALAKAIPQLTAPTQAQFRDVLTERLAHMTAATLHEKLQDGDGEIRRAAARACAMRDEREHVPDLIRLLEDPEPPVARAAHMALKTLTRQDFGPAKDAGRAERNKAVAAWNAWWQKNGGR